MKKYLGNKSKILEEIYSEAKKLCPEAETVFDAFSGTTNVGRFFRSKGFSVISNDVNATSFLLGEVYLKINSLPTFEKLFSSNCKSINKIKELEASGELHTIVKKLIALNRNTNNISYLESIIDSRALKLLAYLSFAATDDDCNDETYDYELKACDFIWRNYCFNGDNSEYFNLVSQKSLLSQIEALHNTQIKRNNLLLIQSKLKSVFSPPYNIEAIDDTIVLLKKEKQDKHIDNIIRKLEQLKLRKNHVGRRMFFSEVHGHRIDTINNLNLLWLRSGLVDKNEYNYLQCSLVEAVALFSNTSATYQAFYKTYRENTKQEFRLVVPEITSSIKEHFVYCNDTFEIIDKIQEKYDLLYLDPPYNWRIYDSNYHLLNLIAGYNDVADSILEFEEGIAGAAGENRRITREYTNYNKRETFEDLLFSLIIKAKCKYIILSYSDSLSNHNKNSLSSVERIESFLMNPNYFDPSFYKKVLLNSINFESRKSEKKDKIHELLFIAKKKE